MISFSISRLDTNVSIANKYNITCCDLTKTKYVFIQHFLNSFLRHGAASLVFPFHAQTPFGIKINVS
jgi:hypothetical protein